MNTLEQKERQGAQNSLYKEQLDLIRITGSTDHKTAELLEHARVYQLDGLDSGFENDFHEAARIFGTLDNINVLIHVWNSPISQQKRSEDLQDSFAERVLPSIIRFGYTNIKHADTLLRIASKYREISKRDHTEEELRKLKDGATEAMYFFGNHLTQLLDAYDLKTKDS